MNAASGEALAHVVDHVSPVWLDGPRPTGAKQSDRCLTLVDDAIAWVCAARNADATSNLVSTLPLLDFLR